MIPDVNLKDPNQKWLIRSALQKCIRRGYVEKAVKCAGLLYSMDLDYLRRSLAVIAVEDVGIANAKATYNAIAVYRNKALLGKEHRDILGHVVTELASGSKSRAFCELCFAVELKKGVAVFEDKDELLEQMDSTDYEVAYKAAVAIFKICKNDKELHKKAMAKVDSLFEDEAIKLMVGNCLAIDIEGMSRAAYAISKLAIEADDLELEKTEFPPETLIKGVPSAAYDMHVHHGKLAIKAFHTSLSKVSQTMSQLTDGPVKALGSIIFINEGGLVDNRLMNPALNVIKAEQDRMFMEGYGVPKDLVEPLTKLVCSEWDRLNSKRLWASKM